LAALVRLVQNVYYQPAAPQVKPGILCCHAEPPPVGAAGHIFQL
jgi:hypothetical protein